LGGGQKSWGGLKRVLPKKNEKEREKGHWGTGVQNKEEEITRENWLTKNGSPRGGNRSQQARVGGVVFLCPRKLKKKKRGAWGKI